MASLRQKQYSVLGMSTLSFAVNFAVWTMFSIIGIRIKDELGLSESQFGLMVALPILTGSLVRLPLGLITDRFGGRIVFFIHMLLVAIPIYGLAFASQYWLAAPSRSASPTPRPGSRRSARAPRWASSAPATPARRSPTWWRR